MKANGSFTAGGGVVGHIDRLGRHDGLGLRRRNISPGGRFTVSERQLNLDGLAVEPLEQGGDLAAN
mgnify:CR=1 FL=1